MKTLKLISTRWVLIMAYALIGSAALFTACEQQSMDDLAPLETAIDSSIDDRSGYQFLRPETVEFKGWGKVFDANKADLKGKDIKLEIMPSTAVATINVNARWSGRQITQFKNTGAWKTKVVEVRADQLTGSETHIDVHSWTNFKTKFYVKVYVRNGGGVNPPPPTGGGCNTTASFPTSFALGIDGGQPVEPTTGTNSMRNTEFTLNGTTKTRYQLIPESGAKFVRINFFRPSNFSQNDYSWLNTYDNIVDHFRSKNIAIYAVITDVVGGDNRSDYYPTNESSFNQNQWIDKYVEAFEKIAQRYCGKIAIYETFNEPNAWAPRDWGAKSRITETQFASMLDKTYRRLKPNGTNPYNITLVTGPLEAHDRYPQNPGDIVDYNGAAFYFNEVLNKGRQNHNWNNNNYPFDAIGYHIYVSKYMGGEFNQGLEKGIDQSLAAIKNITNSLPAHKRKIYLSEIGWNSELMHNRLKGNVTTTEEAQANFMMRAIKHLASNHSSTVKAVSFFSLMSFNSVAEGVADFGIVRSHNFGNKQGYKQPCFCAYQQLAANPWNHWNVKSKCGVSDY